jgi:hypothetical protein
VSKRISKKVREEAALIMGAAASNSFMNLFELADCIGASDAAATVAHSAWAHAFNRLGGPIPADPDADAEAECLLRTGWSPS